jgi:hypothetical protein
MPAQAIINFSTKDILGEAIAGLVIRAIPLDCPYADGDSLIMQGAKEPTRTGSWNGRCRLAATALSLGRIARLSQRPCLTMARLTPSWT